MKSVCFDGGGSKGGESDLAPLCFLCILDSMVIMKMINSKLDLIQMVNPYAVKKTFDGRSTHTTGPTEADFVSQSQREGRNQKNRRRSLLLDKRLRDDGSFLGRADKQRHTAWQAYAIRIPKKPVSLSISTKP